MPVKFDVDEEHEKEKEATQGDNNKAYYNAFNKLIRNTNEKPTMDAENATVREILCAVLGNVGSHPAATCVGNIINLPLFQRRYCWTQQHWQVLWEDALQASKDKEDHRLGTLLMMHPKEQPANCFTCVDGQQRLSTIIMLLCSVWSKIRSLHANGGNDCNEEEPDQKKTKHTEDNQTEEGQRLEKLLRELLIHNHEVFQEWVEKAKLPTPPELALLPTFSRFTPTHFDRLAFYAALTGILTEDDESGVECDTLGGCKAFFEKCVSNLTIPELLGIVEGILDHFVAVIMILKEHCDPQMVFESFARKAAFAQKYYKLMQVRVGRPISTLDLIRNFVLGHLSVERQFDIYQSTWCSLEVALGLTNEDEENTNWFGKFALKEWTQGGDEAVYDDKLNALDKLDEVGKVYPIFTAAFMQHLEALKEKHPTQSQDELVKEAINEMLEAAKRDPPANTNP